MPGIFLGAKFEVRVFFWVRNKPHRTPPPVIYTASIPLPWELEQPEKRLNYWVWGEGVSNF